jgi:hypothetical protein
MTRLFSALFLAFALLVAATPVASATEPTAQAIDADHSLSGAFTLRRSLLGFDRPLVSTGAFTLAPAQGLFWETLQPFAGRMVLSKRGIFKLADDGSASLLASADQAALVATLMASVLGGDWDQLRATFTLSPLPSAGEGWGLRLQPRPGALLDGMVSRIDVYGQQFVNSLLIEKTSGDQDQITLSEQVIRPLPLPPALSAMFEGKIE